MGKQLFPLVLKSQLVPSSFYKKEKKNHLLSFTSSLCFYHVFHRLLIKFVIPTRSSTERYLFRSRRYEVKFSDLKQLTEF